MINWLNDPYSDIFVLISRGLLSDFVPLLSERVTYRTKTPSEFTPIPRNSEEDDYEDISARLCSRSSNVCSLCWQTQKRMQNETPEEKGIKQNFLTVKCLGCAFEIENKKIIITGQKWNHILWQQICFQVANSDFLSVSWHCLHVFKARDIS